MNGSFPLSPGLYIAQRGADVVLIKITGMYPTLQLGKSVSIDRLITGNSIKEASKDVLCNIATFPEQWIFSRLDCINIEAFPRTSFKPNGNLDLSTDEYVSMRNKYYRLTQSGVTYPKIASAFVFEYKITMDQAIELFNKFDKEASYALY